MNQIRRLILAFALMAGIAPAVAQAPPPVPAMPDTERRTTYSITGSTCACAVGFQLYGDSTDYANWLEVFVNGALISQSGNWTITSPTGSLASIPRPITDAVLTFTSAQTGTVQIVGARRPRRVSQFAENRGVAARDLNQVLTDIIAQNREVWDKINDVTGRTVLAAPGETLAILPKLSSRQNTGACFDSGGNLTTCTSVPTGSFAAGSGITFTGTNPTTISTSFTLGTAATQNVGTSGANVPLLNGNNTWSGTNTFTNLQAPAGCVRMWPNVNQGSGAWVLLDANGIPIPTIGTTSQGLQEGINYSVRYGQCMQVFGQGLKQVYRGTGTTHNNTLIDGLTSTADMLIGDYVTAFAAGGVAAFTQITAINSGTSISVNNATSASAVTTVTVTRGPGPNLQSFISASATIDVPPFEQWSFDAFGVNLTFSSTVNSAGLQFDSGIIGHFGWYGGQIVYQAGSPSPISCAVNIAPRNQVPADGIYAFGDSDIFISNIAAPAASSAGQGVWCVSLANGSVVNNHIGSNELNGTGAGATPNATFGFVVANAAANTSFKGNKVSFADVHLVASVGVLLGTSSTNQANYTDNDIYANVSPGLGASCFSNYGSNNKLRGSCRNDQAGGAVSQGINFQSGANRNTFDISYTVGGVTTPLVDNGSDNSGFLNGLLKSGGWISAKRLNAVAGPVSALPACGSATAPEGSMASVTDANSNVWGAGVAAGGANHVLAYCNGGGWTIAGK
jgi:hypothetical protein